MADYPKELLPIIEELKQVLLRGFEVAREIGRSEGESNLRQELEGILHRKVQPPVMVKPEPIAEKGTSPVSQRAPKGSVRPAIQEVLQHVGGNGGLTPNEILMGVHSLGHTLIKPETIRTTLHKMYTENVVKRSGDRWMLIKHEGPGESPGPSH